MMHQQAASSHYSAAQGGSQHYQGQSMAMMGQSGQAGSMMGQRPMAPYRPSQQGEAPPPVQGTVGEGQCVQCVGQASPCPLGGPGGVSSEWGPVGEVLGLREVTSGAVP